MLGSVESQVKYNSKLRPKQPCQYQKEYFPPTRKTEDCEVKENLKPKEGQLLKMKRIIILAWRQRRTKD